MTWLEKLVDLISPFADREKEELSEALSREKNADPDLKIKIFYLLRDLQKQHRRPFGMIIVLGWRDEWSENYSSVPDIDQNLYSNQPLNLAASDEEEALIELEKTADFDGAIFAKSDGLLVASGIFLENMNTKEVPRLINPDHAKDLSEAFGFANKVHTRHLVSIAASYRLKGATIYVVSEEDGSVRIFENGRIIWSTLRQELSS